MRPIEAILFDADGVLQRPTTRWRTALAALPALSDAATLDRLCRDLARVEAAFLERTSGFEAAVAALVATIGHGLSAGDVHAILNAIVPDPAILRLVELLRSSGTRCYLATNQQACRADHMSEILGYRGMFDGEFYSCRLGCAKPKQAFFEGILAHLTLPAEAVLFFDDRPENVAAARKVGIEAERFEGSSGIGDLLALLARYDVRLSRD